MNDGKKLATFAHEVTCSFSEIAKPGKATMWHIAEFGFSGTGGPTMCFANDIKDEQFKAS